MVGTAMVCRRMTAAKSMVDVASEKLLEPHQRVRHVGCRQLGEFVNCQLQVDRSDRILEMGHLRRADDRSGDDRLLYHPGESDLRSRDSPPLGDRGDDRGDLAVGILPNLKGKSKS